LSCVIAAILDYALDFLFVYVLIWVIVNIGWLVFPEEGEAGPGAIWGCIEGACLHILCIVTILIFHVIGKCDQQQLIEVLLEFILDQTLIKHTVKFFLNASGIVRMLHFQES